VTDAAANWDFVDAVTLVDEALANQNSFQMFLNEAGCYPLLTALEEVRLAKRIERGDKAAKELLVNSNLRLVVSIAKGYQTNGITLGDLVQEGIFGLIRAAEKYDHRKGFRFSTYAGPWIRQAVQRGAANRSKNIHVPANVDQRRRRVLRVQRELEAELGRPATVAEVGARTNLTPKQVSDLSGLPRSVRYTDQTVFPGYSTGRKVEFRERDDKETRYSVDVVRTPIVVRNEIHAGNPHLQPRLSDEQKAAGLAVDKAIDDLQHLGPTYGGRRTWGGCGCKRCRTSDPEPIRATYEFVRTPPRATTCRQALFDSRRVATVKPTRRIDGGPTVQQEPWLPVAA
jgi:RNA polymerase sigma factor (sigma-70 family)